MKECIESMKLAAKWLKRGKYMISEAESVMDNSISMCVSRIENIDERVETIRKLKRKKYRMLLEATKQGGC